MKITWHAYNTSISYMMSSGEANVFLFQALSKAPVDQRLRRSVYKHEMVLCTCVYVSLCECVSLVTWCFYEIGHSNVLKTRVTSATVLLDAGRTHRVIAQSKRRHTRCASEKCSTGTVGKTKQKNNENPLLGSMKMSASIFATICHLFYCVLCAYVLEDKNYIWSCFLFPTLTWAQVLLPSQHTHARMCHERPANRYRPVSKFHPGCMRTLRSCSVAELIPQRIRWTARDCSYLCGRTKR